MMFISKIARVDILVFDSHTQTQPFEYRRFVLNMASKVDQEKISIPKNKHRHNNLENMSGCPLNVPVASYEQKTSFRIMSTSGQPGYLGVQRGGGSQAVCGRQTSPKQTCAEAIAAFAARDPCTFSTLLTTILAFIEASNVNFNSPVPEPGITDAMIFALVPTICPTSTLQLSDITTAVTDGLKLGIFIRSPAMCEIEDPPLMVCINVQFGFAPQNLSLYREMGNTPYYPFALGLLNQ